MVSSSGSGISTLKWQIALGLGAVGAVGLAYWYMKTSKNQSLHSVEEVKNEVEETPFQRAQRFKTEGNENFRRGKYDEAISSYNKAIEIIPEEYKTDLATYYQNRAAAYEQLKKWSSVISDCEKAIELNNKYEKALYRYVFWRKLPCIGICRIYLGLILLILIFLLSPVWSGSNVMWPPYHI